MDEAKCPACGVEGKRVKTITLRSLLRPEKQAAVGEGQYFFCGSMGCETVYFTEEGEKTFSTLDLTVRVGIKEFVSPRPVCYCFDHNMEEIFDEVERTGRSTVVADIRKRIQEVGCSCETQNPQGACCLGTVQGVVLAAFARFGGEEGSPKMEGEEKGCCGSGDCCK